MSDYQFISDEVWVPEPVTTVPYKLPTAKELFTNDGHPVFDNQGICVTQDGNGLFTAHAMTNGDAVVSSAPASRMNDAIAHVKWLRNRAIVNLVIR